MRGFFFLSFCQISFYPCMETPKITPEDVKNVAKGINQELTDEEIKQVIEGYASAEDQDPTATWNLIVEELIYQIKS